MAGDTGTLLITGANRGIGLEFTRRYAEEGWRVHAACREPKDAVELLELEGDIHVHKLDVTHPKQLAALKRELGNEPIDLLINNAGIIGQRDGELGGIDYDSWEEVLRINTLAPLRVAEAFAGNVAASDRKLIVSITSRLGSIAENDGGGRYAYRSSKAALNAAMKSLSVDLAPQGVTVALFHPGWVRTDMGGPSAAVATGDSVAGMRKVIAGLTSPDTGRFFNYDGSSIAW